MIPMDLFQKNKPIINFTNYYIISKFELFSKGKMDSLYIIEIMQT